MEDRPRELSMLPRRLSSSQTNLSNVSGPALSRPQRHHSGSSSPRRLSGNVTPDMLPRKKSINELTPNMLSRLSVFEQQEEAGDWSGGAGLEDARPRGFRRSSRDGVHGGRRSSKGEVYKKERHRLTKEEMDHRVDRGSSARDARGMPIREESLERRKSSGKEYAESYAESTPDSEQNQPQKSIGTKVFDYLVRRFSSTEESVSRDASAVRAPAYATQDDSVMELESQTSEKDEDGLSIEEHLSSTGYGTDAHILDSTSYETHDYFYEEKDSEVYALNDEQVSLTDSTEMLEHRENRKKTIDSEVFGFVVRRLNDEQMSNTDTESEGLIDFEDEDDVLSRSAKVTSYYESTLRQKEKEKETAKRLAIIQDENGRILPTIEIEEADQHDVPDIKIRAAGHKKKKTSMAKGILNYLFRNRISDLDASPISKASPVESRVLESPSSKAEEAVRDFLAESCVANPSEASEGGAVEAAEVPPAFDGHDEDFRKESDLVPSTTEEGSVLSSESLPMRLLKWTFGMASKDDPDTPNDPERSPANSDQPSDNPEGTGEKFISEIIPEEAEGSVDEDDETLAQKPDENDNFLEQNQSDDRDLVILIVSLLLVVYILTL